MSEQVAYWKPLMECASRADTRRVSDERGLFYSTAEPVYIQDVETALKGFKDGTPGPDWLIVPF